MRGSETSAPGRWAGTLTVAVAVAAAVALGAASGLPTELFREWQLERAAAAAPLRETTARLTGISHASLATRRGGDTSMEGLALFAEAKRIAATDASPHLRGKAFLLHGETTAAIEQLQLASAGGDASALSDLAGALFAEADDLDVHEPALDAVVAARKAIAASPKLAAAHFNLALALDRLGLTDEARAAFERAAGLEPGTPWAAEAMTRAGALRQQRPASNWTATERRLKDTSDPQARRALILSNVHFARIHAEGPYLTEWADERIQGNVREARAALELARTIGNVLHGATGERLVLDAVAAIDRAEARGDDAALSLAHAQLTYREGRLARRDRDETRAIARLSRAAEELERFQSPLQAVARYYMAGALFEEGRIDEALAVLDSLDAVLLDAKGYRGLAAQVGWERGICLVLRGSFAEALDVYQRSRARSVAIGEHELAGRFDGLTAEALEYLGQPREAWAYRARSLRAYDTRKAVGLTTAAQLQLAERQWARAGALLDYAVPQALQAQDAIVAAHALAQRSVALDELGDHDGAARDRKEAAQWIRRISAPASRKRLDVELEIAEGVARRTTSPQTALAHFTRAIAVLREGGHSTTLPRLYFERARTHEVLGDVARQRADLRTGLEVVATWRTSITDIEQRAAISLWSDAIRRDLIALELAAGDVAAAFSYIDDRLTAADVNDSDRGLPRTLGAARRELATHAAIVELVNVRERVIALVIRSHGAYAITLPATATRIAAAAEAMRRADDATFPAAAAALYDFLIAPIQHRLEDVTTLAVVPERELTGIPFGALRDASRGRYLIERSIVVHAPNAGAAILWSRRSLETADATLLSIGASTFDQKRYVSAVPLPAVAREASDIAALSSHARLLSAEDATVEAVQEAIAEAAVIHYAGHIVGRGADTRLLLAPGRDRDSLSAREISRLQLRKARVVVLAACRGAATSEPHAVIADMASGFLAAGAPVVIASATDLDDESASGTMVRLHSLLEDVDDAADAVRRTALLDLQQSTDVPLSMRLLVLGGTRSLVSARGTRPRT